jgi:hypothetical protein
MGAVVVEVLGMDAVAGQGYQPRLSTTAEAEAG